MGDGNKNFYESMPTSTAPSTPSSFDQKAFIKALKAMPGAIDIPLFFSSTIIDPDACFQMKPDKMHFYAMINVIDKNTKTVYICGINVRDSLIKKGVAFQNYKPTGGERNERKPNANAL